MQQNALGMIETKGLVGAIEASDAASKAADIRIASVEVTDDACVTVRIEGELAAVQVAVEAGSRAAERVGKLTGSNIIPRPSSELSSLLDKQGYINTVGDKLVMEKLPPATTNATSLKHGSPEPKHQVQPPKRPKTVAKPVALPTAPEQTATQQVATRQAATQPKPPEVESAPVATTPSTHTSSESSVQAAPVIAPNPDFAELESMPVVKLRQFARTITNLPIQGRQISMANKGQLLDAIRSIVTSG